MPEVKDLLDLIEGLAPKRLAAEWDNVGLMVGRMSAPADKVALALDPTVPMIKKAHEIGADVLLTHHPLIFKPLKKLDLDDPVTAAAALAIKLDISVAAAHTNLDAARSGVARALAEVLGLVDCQVLEPIKNKNNFKLSVFTPAGYENKVLTAMFEAGAGHIDGYQKCSFAQRGVGTFLAPETGQPFVGRAGFHNRAAESRLEVLVEAGDLDGVIGALTAAHPYETPAFDVYPLAPPDLGEGFGCLGLLENPLPLDEFSSLIMKKLDISGLRTAAPVRGPVRRIALMPGSGGSYIRLAKKRRADVLISGDLGYHQAREAEELGLCLIDAGHWATERPVLEFLSRNLRREAQKRALEMECIILGSQKDPWHFMEE